MLRLPLYRKVSKNRKWSGAELADCNATGAGLTPAALVPSSTTTNTALAHKKENGKIVLDMSAFVCYNVCESSSHPDIANERCRNSNRTRWLVESLPVIRKR